MSQDYTKILNNPSVISWAKKHLKKQDRIVWYLKQVCEYPNIHPNENLIHYYSMDIPEINNFSPMNETESQLISKFQEMEDEYVDKISSSSRLIPFTREDKTVLYLGDDWQWVLLKRPSCRVEGKSMGHCGNASGRTSDRILSLRKTISRAGRLYHEPHATFILLKGKKLGEMKGRQNYKPDPKYHAFILELLKSDLVSGITGGGYLPQNNFDLSDLSEEMLSEFIKTHSYKIEPYLIPIIENRSVPDFLVSKKVYRIKEVKNALNWVKDEGILSRIALESKIPNMRVEAIERIEDQKILLKIIKERNDSKTMYAALDRITDESILEELFLGIGKHNSHVASHCVSRVYDPDLLLKFLNSTNSNSRLFTYIISKIPEVIPDVFYKEHFTRHTKQVMTLECKSEEFLAYIVKHEEDFEIVRVAISRIGSMARLQSLLEARDGRILDIKIQIELVRKIWDKEFLVRSIFFHPLPEKWESELSFHVIDQIGFSCEPTDRDRLLEKLHNLSQLESVKAYARFKMTNKGIHLITATSEYF